MKVSENINPKTVGTVPEILFKSKSIYRILVINPIAEGNDPVKILELKDM